MSNLDDDHQLMDLPTLPPMAATFDTVIGVRHYPPGESVGDPPPDGTENANVSLINNNTITATAVVAENANNNNNNNTNTAGGNEDNEHASSSNNNNNNQPPPPPRKTRGSRKGSKRTDRPQSFWYRLCELYEANRDQFKSQVQFLRSDVSGDEVSDDNRMSFSRAYKKYKNGELKDVQETRLRKRKFEPLEERVVEYISRMTKLHEEQEQQEDEAAVEHENEDVEHEHDVDHNNTNSTTITGRATKRHRRNPRSQYVWVDVQEKAKEWARELGVDASFQASAGWVDNVMKRHERNQRLAKERQDQLAANHRRKSESEQVAVYEKVQAALKRQAYVELAVDQKRLQVGDRVTVLDESRTAGDCIIREMQHFDSYEYSPSISKAEQDQQRSMPSLVLERKYLGTTESLAMTDVRRVIKFHVHDEDSPAIHKWLETTMHQQHDPYLTTILHYSLQPGKGTSNRATSTSKPHPIRPLWEQQRDDSIDALDEEHKYAEKISMSALRGRVMASFHKDKKERQVYLEKLEALETRNPTQENVRHKLQQAHELEVMTLDLFQLLNDVPQCSADHVTYEVEYQTLDQSGRATLFAQSPNGVATATSKPYYPRTLTLQGLPEALQRPLVGKFCHQIAIDGGDIPLVNMVCNLAETQMMQASDLIPSWIQYRDDQHYWETLILETHPGIEAHHAAILPLCLIQGGRYETWQRLMEEQTTHRKEAATPGNNVQTMHDFVFRLQWELRAFRDVLLQCPKFKKWTQMDRAALLQSGNYTNAILNNVLMMRVLHSCEREILTIAQRVFVDHGWRIRARGISSLFVEASGNQGKNDKKKQSDLKEEVAECARIMSTAEATCECRGYSEITFVEKPLFGLQWTPIAELEEARKALRELKQGETDNNEDSEGAADVGANKNNDKDNENDNTEGQTNNSVTVETNTAHDGESNLDVGDANGVDASN